MGEADPPIRGQEIATKGGSTPDLELGNSGTGQGGPQEVNSQDSRPNGQGWAETGDVPLPVEKTSPPPWSGVLGDGAVLARPQQWVLIITNFEFRFYGKPYFLTEPISDLKIFFFLTKFFIRFFLSSQFLSNSVMEFQVN